MREKNYGSNSASDPSKGWRKLSLDCNKFRQPTSGVVPEKTKLEAKTSSPLSNKELLSHSIHGDRREQGLPPLPALARHPFSSLPRWMAGEDWWRIRTFPQTQW